MQFGVRYHQSGDLEQAEAIYRQVLAHDPRHIDALHLLGVIAYHSGRLEEAEELISRAIKLSPKTALFHDSLGRLLMCQQKLPAAIKAYRGTLPTARFPAAVVRIEIDPALVDVNVHPTKAEVRFLRDWEVHRAVHEAADQGLSFGAPTEREIELAEEILSLVPSCEQIRLVSSGTEAAMSALRLARGVTGRAKIIKLV